MAPEIFISYSSKNDDLASSTVNYLEKKDVTCFIAPRDISPGKDYSEEVIKAVEKCQHFLLILTKESNASDHVRNEVNKAFNSKKNIIVFRTENISLSNSLEYYLSNNQWLDAFQHKPEVYFEQLYSYIKGLPLPALPKKLLFNQKIIKNSLLAYLVISVLLFAVFGIRILHEYGSLNTRNPKGMRFIDAIKESGLVDISNKHQKNRTNMVEADDIYRKAKREIFISGSTLYRTTEYQGALLDSLADKGIKVYLLFLHPNTADSTVFQNTNRKFGEFSRDIQNSLSLVKQRGLDNNKNVEIRFCDILPGIIGLMIDGDLNNNNGKPSDEGGVVNVCPYLKSPVHVEWVLQFRNDKKRDNAFKDYAAEFRHIWKNAVSDTLLIKQ